MSAITLKSVLRDQQRQQRADARRGQRRKNRDGMNVAFIEHAQNDVHGHQRRQNQDRLVRKRRLESLRRSLESRMDAGGQTDFLLRQLDGVDGLSQRNALAPG